MLWLIVRRYLSDMDALENSHQWLVQVLLPSAVPFTLIVMWILDL
jgi:hypothetical protein